MAKQPADKTNEKLKLPIILTGEDLTQALALKHLLEQREKRNITWASLTRKALSTLAAHEGLTCK